MKRVQHHLLSILSALLLIVMCGTSRVALADKSFTDQDLMGTWSRIYYDLANNTKYKYIETLTFNAGHSYEDKTVGVYDPAQNGFLSEFGDWTFQNNTITYVVRNSEHSSNWTPKSR